MAAYTYGDEEMKYSDKYVTDANFAIDSPNNDFAIDYTRQSTKVLTQITKKHKKESYLSQIKDVKKWFKKWKNQYNGLTFSESIVRFVYNLSHFGITIGTIIYCIVFIIVIGSTVWSNYINNNELNIEFIIIGINCIIGIISLIIGILPLTLLFDYVTTCAGLGFTLGASWKINDGYKNSKNSTLVVFGLIMILIIPFRVFWWHKFYPNKMNALDLYTALSQRGLLQHVAVDETSDQ
eukprot:352724_1